MSGKLDQSLDQIMTDSKAARGRGKPRPRRAAAAKAKAAIAAPSGGVRKNTRPTKAAATPVANALAAGKEGKIIVSNLPSDVTEAQIKDYFNQTVGAVRKVLLTYNSDGRSVGVATVIFNKSESASKAAKDLHGVKVDGKPMKIELVLGAQFAPGTTAPKSLAERATAPKPAAPKDKPKAAGQAKGKAAANNAPKKAGRAGRPKKKTAAELDAEMADYFVGGTAANTGNATAAAATTDAAMVDEVL